MSLFRKVLFALAAGAAVWAALLLFVPGAGQERLFFFSARELHFFDYFVPRSVLTMARPYAETGLSPAVGAVSRMIQCYPALAVLFTGLFPESLSGAVTCQILGTLVYLFGTALLLRKYAVPQTLSLLSLTVAAPFLFTIEVGNLILFAAGATGIFLAWYDSTSRGRRYVAALALAVAATLKISPALLGCLYLCSSRRRDWNGAFLSAGLCLALVFVPFAFLGGVDGFVAWMENAREISREFAPRNPMGLYGLVKELIAVSSYSSELMPYVHTPLRLVSSVFAAVLLVRAFAKGTDEFLRVCLISMGALFLPPTMMCYTVLYVVPLFIIGTYRSTGALARSFAITWLTCCLPLQMPLLFGSANVCFSAAAMLDLSILLLGEVANSQRRRVGQPTTIPTRDERFPY